VSFEDDTVFNDPQTIQTLVEPFKHLARIGFVEGVQCGRWGTKMIGAWNANSIDRPFCIETLLPPATRRYDVITAGGFYGYATNRELYFGHKYYWDDQQPWGPDVNFGFYVRRMGYGCIIDWSLVFGHDDYGKILWPEGKLTKVVYNLNISINKWERQDVESATDTEAGS
jgi:hypothetical protein